MGLTRGEFTVPHVFQYAIRRPMNEAEFEYHSKRLDNGEISPEDFIMEIVGCPEFEAVGLPFSPRNAVRIVLGIFLGRPCNEAELDYHANRIAEGMEVKDFAKEVSVCPEFEQRYETAVAEEWDLGRMQDGWNWDGDEWQNWD